MLLCTVGGFKGSEGFGSSSFSWSRPFPTSPNPFEWCSLAHQTWSASLWQFRWLRTKDTEKNVERNWPILINWKWIGGNCLKCWKRSVVDWRVSAVLYTTSNKSFTLSIPLLPTWRVWVATPSLFPMSYLFRQQTLLVYFFFPMLMNSSRHKRCLFLAVVSSIKVRKE